MYRTLSTSNVHEIKQQWSRSFANLLLLFVEQTTAIQSNSWQVKNFNLWRMENRWSVFTTTTASTTPTTADRNVSGLRSNITNCAQWRTILLSTTTPMPKTWRNWRRKLVWPSESYRYFAKFCYWSTCWMLLASFCKHVVAITK